MIAVSGLINRRGILKGALGGAALMAPAIRARAQGSLAELPIAMGSAATAYGGLRVAEVIGLFEKQGLKPRFIVADSGNGSTAALLSRSVPFAASGPSQALAARAKGSDIVIAGNLYRGLAGSLLLSKTVVNKLGVDPRAPMEQRLKALDGLIIASPSATSAYTSPVKNSAEQVGAKPKVVYMGQPAMPAALETGAIHGMMAAVPVTSAVILKGGGVMWISGPRAEFPKEFMPVSSTCLQTTESYLNANPDMLRKMHTIMQDLATFIAAKPDEARRAMGQVYSNFDAATLEDAFSQDSPSWLQPVLTLADMQQERKLLEEMETISGVRELDLNAILKMPA